jgi:4-amino-4-deoxy-L-arabinose transferase-like glycosyltransferase
MWHRRTRERHHFLIGILVAVTLLKGVLWSGAIPFGQAPDEFSHFSLIQIVAEFGRLPRAGERYMSDELAEVIRLTEAGRIAFHRDRRQTFDEGVVAPNEPGILALAPTLRRTFERERPSTANFVPPLYHTVAALGYRLFYHQDALARFFGARLASVVFAVALVVVAYGLAREVFPDEPAMWVSIPTVVSFQPMVTYLGAVANSDILLFLLFGLATWLIVRILRRGLNWRLAVGLGVTIGLGLLTKPMVLTCGLGVAVALLVELARRPGERLKVLAMALLIVGLMLTIGGWYMLRNYQVQGSFLYNNPEVSNPYIERHLDPRPDLSLAEYWSEIYYPRLKGFTFNSYWGQFGWVDTPMPEQVYRILRWICDLSLIGLALGAVVALRKRPVSWSRFLPFLTLIVLSISLLPPVVARGYLLARRTGFLFSSLQGRYQLGACLAQATLLVYGLTRLVPARARSLAHLVVRSSAIALNAYALVAVILPRYY